MSFTTPLISPLISWTGPGLYCSAGDFHIDPSRGVKTAVITHAHSDHARRGSERYLCARSGLGLLKARLGASIRAEGVPYGESVRLGGVSVSFHPAGHILGSAQIRVEYRGEVWVVSGDYKREPDPSCEPFEPLKCDSFVTEATFGTPKYAWDKTRDYGSEIHSWWMENAERGENSVLHGYSLGKAQRILAELAPQARKAVLVDSAIEKLSQCYRDEGRKLAPTLEFEEVPASGRLSGVLILVPPGTQLHRDIGPHRTAFASGWMQGSARRYSGGYDHGFVMSDHADWNDLNRTIDETGASRVFVLHRDGALVRHLRKRGIDAHPASVLSRENYPKLEPFNLSLSNEW